MRVHVGWPLVTLAAFVVGYVVEVAVAPPHGERVPCHADATVSAQRVEAPPPLAPMDAPSAVAWKTEGAPLVEGSVAPPPLRGSRPRFDPEDGLDWGFVSAAAVESFRFVVRRTLGPDAAPNAPDAHMTVSGSSYRRWSGPNEDFFKIDSTATAPEATSQRWFNRAPDPPLPDRPRPWPRDGPEGRAATAHAGTLAPLRPGGHEGSTDNSGSVHWISGNGPV